MVDAYRETQQEARVAASQAILEAWDQKADQLYALSFVPCCNKVWGIVAHQIDANKDKDLAPKPKGRKALRQARTRRR